jgi:hypothetical protein
MSNNKTGKRPRLEDAKRIEAEMVELSCARNALIRESMMEMRERFDEVYQADCTAAYCLLKNYRDVDWLCVHCENNFMAIAIAQDATAAEFLHHCEECGQAVCFHCVVKALKLNKLHSESIGYACTKCKFFNCNRIMKSTSEDVFSSGYSTMQPTQVKGEKLHTSDAVLCNHNYEKNHPVVCDDDEDAQCYEPCDQDYDV